MSRLFPRLRGCAIALACATGIAAAPSPAAAKTGPYSSSFATALGYSIFINSDADPQGTNDWTCKPSRSKPRPVVLVHGTWENRYDNWAMIAPHLKAAGHCVFALDFGIQRDAGIGRIPGVNGTAGLRESAKELAIFVERVRAATGAAKVDLVGHSQGGVMPRQYLKFEGGQGKVGNLVTLGATHNGTTLLGIATLADQLGVFGLLVPVLGTATEDQLKGSAFLQTLNAGGYTVPGTNYTTIATKFDEVSTPYRATFFAAGPGASVNNVTLQDGCPIDFSDHLSMTYSLRSIWFIKKALDPSLRGWAPCLINPPVI